MRKFWGNPAIDRINLYWNGVRTRTPSTQATHAPISDPTLTNMIDLVHSVYRPLPVDPAFMSALEQTLMNAFATSAVARPPVRLVRPDDTSARPTWLQGREISRRWGVAALSTVGLIALTLAVFFFTLRNGNHPAIVPGTPEASPTTAVVATPSPTAEPVSMYRGGLDRTGEMPGPAPTGRPGVLWRAETGAAIEGPVVVGNGLVYTGTNNGSVHAFDMTTGVEVWSLPSNATIESPSIVLDGATAYISGYDGMVLAVNATTGVEVWRTDPELHVSRRVSFDADTATLYVTGLNPVAYAFDSATGSLKWQTPLGAPQRALANIVFGETLYLGTAEGVLYALNTADGSTRWTWDSGHNVILSLLFANDTVFVPTIANRGEFALVAVDALAGTERWRYSSTEDSFTAAAMIDGNVIFGTDTGKVIAVNAADGQVNWTFAPGNGAIFWAPPSFVDTTAYVFDGNGWLFALDAYSGSEIWRLKVETGNAQSPAITGGVIYVNTSQGSVFALGDEGSELPPALPVASPLSAGEPDPAATPASPASPPVTDGVQVVWESTGGGGGFSGATQLSVAPDGTIWVADPGWGNFQLLDAEGAYIESWTDPDGRFNFVDVEGNPFGAVAFAPDGSFYVLDYGNRQIVSFAPNRTLLSRFGGSGREDGQFAVPNSIAVDPAGNVAVWDPGRGDVQTFASDGTLVSTVRLQTSYTGGYSSNAMTMDADGNFYVVEYSQNRGMVEKFDPEGNLLLTFGFEPGPGMLEGQPLGLGLDDAGNIYVTTIEPSQVTVYSPNGEILISFGATGEENGAFLFPFDVAVDAQGGVYVTDAAQPKLFKLQLPESITAAAPGVDTEANAASDSVELLWEVDGGDAGLGSMALAPDGTIWVADVVSNGFQIFDDEGTLLESWTGTGDGAFTFMRPNGDPFNAITFAADGSFYVLDSNGRRIQAFAPDRSFVRSIGAPGRDEGQFLEPIDIVIDPDGNLAVLDDQRRDIQIFTPDGMLVSTILLPSAVPAGANMNALAIDGDGNFYVSELTEDFDRMRLVEKFDAEGNLLQQFGVAEGPGKLRSHPFGIAIDEAGNLYVSEADPTQRVVVFTADGEYLTEFGGAGSPGVSFLSHGDFVLDGQGNAYITDWGNNRLIKLRLPDSLSPANP